MCCAAICNFFTSLIKFVLNSLGCLLGFILDQLIMLLNICFVVSGIVLLSVGTGLIVHVNDIEVEGVHLGKVEGIEMIVLGIVILFMTIVGCCSNKNGKCYSVFMFLVFTLQVIAAIMFGNYASGLKSGNDLDPDVKKVVDCAYSACCLERVSPECDISPDSCSNLPHVFSDPNSCQNRHVYRDEITQWMHDALVPITIVLICTAAVEFILILLGCCAAGQAHMNDERVVLVIQEQQPIGYVAIDDGQHVSASSIAGTCAAAPARMIKGTPVLTTVPKNSGIDIVTEQV